MSKRTGDKYVIQGLRRQCAALQQQAVTLLKQQRHLALRCLILNGWCDAVSLLQLSLSVQEAGGSSSQDATLAAAAHFNDLLREEVVLLQQCSSDGDRHAAAVTAGLDMGQETAAPLSDPMALWRCALAQLLPQTKAVVTHRELAVELRDTVLEVGLMLHHLKSMPADSPSWQRVRQQTQEQLHSYFGQALSCIMAGRADVVERLAITNLQTMQPDVEGATQHAAHYALLAPALQLTEQQEEVIAVGARLYLKLLDGVLQEQRRLQLQIGEGGEPGVAAAAEVGEGGSCAGPRSSGTSGATSSGSGSGSGSDSGCCSHGSGSSGRGRGGSPHNSFASQQEHLGAEEQKTARLKLLMQKEYVLRAVSSAWFLGMLAWEQMAQMLCLSWPYATRITALVSEIVKIHEARERQAAKGP